MKFVIVWKMILNGHNGGSFKSFDLTGNNHQWKKQTSPPQINHFLYSIRKIHCFIAFICLSFYGKKQYIHTSKR